MSDNGGTERTDHGRESFGDLLRRAREDRGLSLRAAARKVPCSHTTLYDYEHGNRVASVEMVEACEKALELPPGYLQATSANEISTGGKFPGPTRRRPTRVTLAIAALAVLLVGAVAFVLATQDGSSRTQRASITVYNKEARCQQARTDDCRLGLARDPYARYAVDNVVGYVWHGDSLTVDCFVPDGSRVQAEDGTASTKWYQVAVPDADRGLDEAWLTAIRVRPGTEPSVKRCPCEAAAAGPRRRPPRLDPPDKGLVDANP